MTQNKDVQIDFPTVPPSDKAGEDYVCWLESQNSLHLLALNAIHDAVLFMDPNGLMTYVNPTAENLLGRSKAELANTDLLKHFRTVEGEPMGHEIMDRVKMLSDFHCSLAYIRHADGSLIPVEIHVSSLEVQGVMVRIMATCHDLRDELEHRRELERWAMTDRLTGCFNRWWFDERFSRALAWAKETGDWLGLMFIDLDRFKLVNDRSYVFGDSLIATAAAAIQLVLRDTDALVRLGGDEFVFITQGLDLAKVLHIAERVSQALRDLKLQMPDDGSSYQLTASLGVSVLRGDDDRMGKILHFAQEAKRLAKEDGRDRTRVLPDDGGDKPSYH